MKGKAKKCEMRDISGTKPIPILSMAYLRRAKCSLSPAYPWPLFYCPRQSRSYCQIIQKTERHIKNIY